jgi:hypothetical protein
MPDKPPGMAQDIGKPLGMDKPMDKPLGNPDKPKNDNIMIKDELIPNCTAIAQDIMDGKINEKNFIYLSPKCDTQIMNALKSSR